MKRSILIAGILLAAIPLHAQENKDLVKTGYNFGPLPIVAYDADKGLQLGALVQLFNYGDGTNYPNYNSKIHVEGSWFTKGSMLFQLRYDNKTLIPGVRWSSALRADIDKAFDFYGLGGYQSWYDYDKILDGKKGDGIIFSPFYRYKRFAYTFKSDLIGRITDKLHWEGGLFVNYYDISSIDYDSVNKGKDASKVFPTTMPTLFDYYKKTGIISETDSDGGIASGLRAGLEYDTRDKEGAPSRGIWAEGHVTAALPGISESPYYRYSLTWRHYLPIVKDNTLTFAYRLNYEGTFGSYAPFYALPYISNTGEKPDMDGMGGYHTVRGLMRTRVVGLDIASYIAELRWRFARFRIGKQNIALGANLFSDGTMVTRNVDLSALQSITGSPVALVGQSKDTPHITFGAGFRFIMNENFIVAVDYGSPLTHFLKNSPNYNQDGTGAFYINLGYLF